MNYDPHGFLGHRLFWELNRAGYSAAEFAQAVGCSYQHLGRLIQGLSLPSPQLQARIAKKLKIKRRELAKLALSDSARRKIKGFWQLAGVNPECEQICFAWPLLSHEQKTIIISFAEKWAKEDAA